MLVYLAQVKNHRRPVLVNHQFLIVSHAMPDMEHMAVVGKFFFLVDVNHTFKITMNVK